MRKTLRYILGCVSCLIIAVLLPIIPVQSSAVMPRMDYSFDIASIADLAKLTQKVGVSYQLQWYSVLSIIALSGLSIMSGIWIVRLLVNRMAEKKK